MKKAFFILIYYRNIAIYKYYYGSYQNTNFYQQAERTSRYT